VNWNENRDFGKSGNGNEVLVYVRVRMGIIPWKWEEMGTTRAILIASGLAKLRDTHVA